MRLCAAILLIFSAGACGSNAPASVDGGGGADGGVSPCEAVLALDRSCATGADCIGPPHTSNCCGQVQFIGIRASELARYQTLEAQCVAMYPACGCPAQQPFTDDGSRLRFDDTAGVACVQGTCTTFVTECGAPCGAGTTCFSCSDRAGVFAACTTTCTDSAACTDATRPLCQMGSTGNVAGMFCTPSAVACDAQ